VIVEAKTLKIVATAHGKGREHDFKVFKRSWGQCAAEIELLGDSAYQGVLKFHTNARTPVKRSKKKPLTDEQRSFNHDLLSQRVGVENVIRRLKVFRVLKETYRHRRKRFGLRLNLIAGLYNADLVIQ
jgi:hypothetical protein